VVKHQYVLLIIAKNVIFILLNLFRCGNFFLFQSHSFKARM